MPVAHANGVELFYEIFGDPDAEPLLLVMGLGAQMVAWDVSLCETLVERGYMVIRYDNRDVGLSSKFSDVDGMAGIMALFAGGEAEPPPYVIADMAADAAGLLDHLEIERAHVLGASMGGMISQQLTIDHADRVATLTSVMSTTGAPDVGAPTPETIGALMTTFATPASDRASAIAAAIDVSRVLAGGGSFDEVRARERAERSYDRDADASGTVRQMLAVMASPDRTEALGQVTAPTLVVHGELDPLIQPSGGEATAAAIPDAELLVVPDMGHDLPPFAWPAVFDALDRLTSRVDIR